MDKYGFIYLWFDKKHKRYYVGRHWGTENDGYICSSRKMRDNYNYRPTDFKRRIISRIYTSNEDLVVEEQRWLDMIKPEECGYRYYNVTLISSSPSMRGRKHSEETKLKMSLASKGKPKSEEHKEKLRQINLGKIQSKKTIEKKIRATTGKKRSKEFKDMISFYAQNRSEETRRKISENNKRLIAEGKIGMLGKKHSPETIEKMRRSARNRVKKNADLINTLAIAS